MSTQRVCRWLDSGEHKDLDQLGLAVKKGRVANAVAPIGAGSRVEGASGGGRSSPPDRSVQSDGYYQSPHQSRSPSLMKYAEAARELSISINSFRNLVDKDIIQGIRVGKRSMRVRRASIMEIVRTGIPLEK